MTCHSSFVVLLNFDNQIYICELKIFLSVILCQPRIKTMSSKFESRKDLDVESSSVTSALKPSRQTISSDQNSNSLRPIQDIRARDDIVDTDVTSTVSAVTAAVLAVVILLLIFFIIQSVRRRRRMRQGSRLNPPVIHTMAPPAFAPNTAAYTSRSGLCPMNVTWENIARSTSPVISAAQTEPNHTLSSSPDPARITDPPYNGNHSTTDISSPSTSSYVSSSFS